MLDLASLYQEQADRVHPSTTAAVVREESGGDFLAIGVNGAGGGRRRASSFEQACEFATALIRSGRSVDMGLMQINWSAGHLQRRGLSICDAFKPRINIRVGTEILQENYAGCRQRDQRACLVEALSKYNAGTATGGVRNGYVGKVMGNPPLTHAVSINTPRVVPPRPRRPQEIVVEAGPEWQAAVAMTLGGR